MMRVVLDIDHQIRAVLKEIARREKKMHKVSLDTEQRREIFYDIEIMRAVLETLEAAL